MGGRVDGLHQLRRLHMAVLVLQSDLRSNIHTLPDASVPYLACLPARSGRVFKALLQGETVAAKEMEIGRSAALQEAFLTVGHGCLLCVDWLLHSPALPGPAWQLLLTTTSNCNLPACLPACLPH